MSERILIAKLDRGHLRVIGVYDPDWGRVEDSDLFYDQLQRVVKKYNKSDL